MGANKRLRKDFTLHTQYGVNIAFGKCKLSNINRFTFVAKSANVFRLRTITKRFSIHNGARSSILAWILHADPLYVHADPLAAEQNRFLVIVLQFPDNSFKRRKILHCWESEHRNTNILRDSAQEEVTNDLHVLPLWPHLARFAHSIQNQHSSQVVPAQGGRMPAAVIDSLVQYHCVLGAVDAELQLELPFDHHELQEVAEAAIIKVQD